MSFREHLPFSQKKGAVYRLILFVSVLALFIGIFYVTALHARTVTLTPRWSNTVIANQTYNFTITNSNGGSINIVKITKPSSFVDIYCLNNDPVGGWSCSTNGTKSLVSYVEFTGGSFAAGGTMSINISSTPGSSAGDYSFTIKTDDDQSGFNSSTVTASVDTLPPMLNVMNVSDGTRILSNAGHFDGNSFFSNSTGSIVIIFNATDNESSVSLVTLYYNSSNASESIFINPDHRVVGTYDAAITMSNGSKGPGSLFNATLMGNSFILNGTRVLFQVVANDTLRNGNVSNYTSSSTTTTYNFTIDAAAPVINPLAGGVGFNISLSNTTSSRGSTSPIIVRSNNSNANSLINLTVLDSGGSGIVQVWIMNSAGGFETLDNLTGLNGSTGVTTYNFSRTNLTYLVQRVGGFNGDGLYNLSFKATDNVSNVMNTNVTIEIDDSQPNGVVLGTNITQGGKLSEANATLNVAANDTFVIRLQTTNNIDATTARNITVFGNKGIVRNLSLESGTPSGTAVWNLTITNATLINLSNFCDLTATDGSQCNFRFNFSDILGRYNDTLNLTVYVDAVAPNVSIVSPVSLTKNYSTTVLINVSVNDSIGPMRNVSYRWRNSTIFDELVPGAGFGANVSNWLPLSLNSGGNSVGSAQGYWSGTLTISSLVDGNYSIEINATDSANRQNATQFISMVIFDSTMPYNISIRTPGANSFHKDNTTFTGSTTTNITALANETGSVSGGNQSGLLNISFRLENSTVNFPWVPANIGVLQALANGRLYSPDRFNISQIDGIDTNATNGNFTLRLNVTDTAGNQNTSVTINLTIDTTPPSALSIIQPPTTINQSSNFTVNVTAIDSNVNIVQFRWVNDSSAAVIGSRRGEWTLMSMLNSTLFNGTFTNMTDGYGSFLDGNYSIEVNVTDKAGLSTTTFIQLILDKTTPVVVPQSPAANSFQTGNFLINVAINDTGTWNMNLGKITTTNINGTPTFRLINRSISTIGSNATAMLAPTNAANNSNATVSFSQVPNGVYDINVTTNDTAGNINYTVIANVTLDNTAPSVRALNTTPSSSGGAGLSGTIVINVSITDNLGFGPNGLDNTSVVVTFTNTTPLLNRSFQMTRSNYGTFDLWNATVNTVTLGDGDYTLVINATDKAGNVNMTSSIGVTIQNGPSSVKAKNLTFQGGFVSGTSDTIVLSPVFLVNTTANATCKYSLDTPFNYYSELVSTMSNNVSRQHSVSFGFIPDRVANGYSLYYACQDVGGNFTAPEGATRSFTFGVDTRSLFNITLGSAGTNKVRGDYFAVGWNSFNLPKTTLLAQTALPTNYNITNVLSSLGNPTLTTANFTTIFAYDGSTWASYVVGAVTNTFTNFTADTPTATYYINITSANERLEIN